MCTLRAFGSAKGDCCISTWSEESFEYSLRQHELGSIHVTRCFTSSPTPEQDSCPDPSKLTSNSTRLYSLISIPFWTMWLWTCASKQMHQTSITDAWHLKNNNNIIEDGKFILNDDSDIVSFLSNPNWPQKRPFSCQHKRKQTLLLQWQMHEQLDCNQHHSHVYYITKQPAHSLKTMELGINIQTRKYQGQNL